MTAGRRARRDMACDYPAGFGLTLDPATRRPAPNVLVGGSPLRVVRLSDRGAQVVDSCLAGKAVGPQPAARALARRLVDASIANPRPAPLGGPGPEDVTIVVPVRDRPAGLRATLSSLDGLRVVVVDDASEEPLSIEDRQVIRHPISCGPAAARNTGWRSAQSPVVVFLDADCVPAPGWLPRLLAHFADPRVAAVAPRVRSAVGHGYLARYERLLSPLDMGPAAAAVRPRGRVPYVPTACLAVRRCALEMCGGFDEQLRFGEDVDLVWRLAGSGWTVRYEPEAVVFHPPREGLRSWMRQRFDYGRSAAPLAARHGPDVAPAVLSPWSAAVLGLVVAGQVPAGGLAAGLSSLLAARAGRDPATSRLLAAMAVKGHLLACRSLAEALRRAWTPPLLLAALALPSVARRRAAMWLASSYMWPLWDYWMTRSLQDERPEMGPLTWIALRWVDDLCYQSGLWTGSVEQRSVGALVPRWVRRGATASPGHAAAADSSSAIPVSR